MSTRSHRIVWLIPSLLRGGYWAPFLNAIVEARPDTVVVTAAVEDDVRELLKPLVVQVGRLRSVGHATEAKGYRYGVNFLSIGVIRTLVDLRPGLVVCGGFSVWTGLTLLMRPWLRYRVCIYMAGSSRSANFAERPLRLGLRKFFARAADLMITNSSAGADYLVGVLGAKADAVHAFPMMVPEAQLTEPQVPGALAEQPGANMPTSVLYGGRLEPAKGVRDLLEALRSVTERLGETAWHLAVVGDGGDRDALEAFATADPVLSRTSTFVGWKSQSELAEYLDAADLFVYPTHDDIWGSAPLEAMAHGVPVVVSSAAGMADLVESGVNGAIFTAGDVSGLAACLTQLLGDPQALEDMGRHALRTIAEHSATRAAETFLALTHAAEDVS